MDERKKTERAHYDRAVSNRGGRDAGDDLEAYGPRLIAPEFRAPYALFETRVRAIAGFGARVLDIGAGSGVHSLAAAATGATVFATDIAHGPLVLARHRAAANRIDLSCVASDAESLPFDHDTFDVVTSAGALYCFDFPELVKEITRVLKADGAWVIVDSYDANPLYRLNRYMGFLRGRRTHLAVVNVPRGRTLELLRDAFASVETRFHGTAMALTPLLRPLLGPRRTAGFLERVDAVFRHSSPLAFKFVAVARRPRK